MIKDRAKSVMVGGFKVGSCHRCGGGGVIWSCHGRPRSDSSDVTRPPTTVTTSAVTLSDPRHATAALSRWDDHNN